MTSEGENQYRELNKLLSMIRTFDAVNRYLQIELSKLGFSPITFAIMNALYVHNGRMMPTAISKWTFRTRHTISKDLDTLEKQGHVRRERGKDRRSIDIVVTEEGWRKIETVRPLAQEMSRRALSALNREQLQALMITQKQLRKHLDEEIKNSLTTGPMILKSRPRQHKRMDTR